MCTQVIVLEKGGFTPAAELPLTEQEAFRDMYEMGSLFTTQDAGKCSLVTCCWKIAVQWYLLQAAQAAPFPVFLVAASDSGITSLTGGLPCKP